MNRLKPEDFLIQSTYPEYPVPIKTDELLMIILIFILILFVIRILMLRKRNTEKKILIKTIIIYSIIFITGIIYCIIASFEEPTYNLEIIGTYSNVFVFLLVIYFVLIIAEIFCNRMKK